METYQIGGGSGYGCRGWYVGEVVKGDPHANHPEYMVVVDVRRDYYSEDGMSFGVGEFSGYYYYANCRAATPKECAAQKEKEELAGRKREAFLRLSQIKQDIRTVDNFPHGQHNLTGAEYCNTDDFYGGGDWFVVEPEVAIWYVLNNGADGDDWRLNNVRTTGAGALGWRVPFDRDLAEEIMSIDRLLADDIQQWQIDIISQMPTDPY